MTDLGRPLSVLLVEDDSEYLTLIPEQLTGEFQEWGYQVLWDVSPSFDEAEAKALSRHYELILCDVLVDPPPDDRAHGKTEVGALRVIAKIRDRRFCPVVFFSDGPKPVGLGEGDPFVRWADKTRPEEIAAATKHLLDTGIPAMAARLYDDMARGAGSYLWGFLTENWEALGEAEATEPSVLERLVRRRAAVLLARLIPGEEGPCEVGSVLGCEFYIYPPISGKEHRLGEVVREKETHEVRVLLTPHCHLAIQEGKSAPKVESALTVGTKPAAGLLQGCKEADLPKRSQWPAREMKNSPEGRYCFLPRFLEIPDCFCDFLDVQTVGLPDLDERFRRVATLEPPFAEALQSCFLAFYARVGLPSLDPKAAAHLVAQANDG